MTSAKGPEPLLEVARRVCTRAQFAAVEMFDRGLSQRDAALALGISRGAFQDRLSGAFARLRQTISDDESETT